MSAVQRREGASPQSDIRTPEHQVSIIGLGASGHAAARLALAHGETVYVSDTRTDARIEASARELRTLGADVELGRHDLDRISASPTIVVSPGIPPDAPVLATLRERGVEWIGEPEFAVRFHKGSLIAITGTNGKTTTAALLSHLLERAGVDSALGGNVGGGLAPAASEVLLRTPKVRWLILEMSSFQLADTRDFSPDIGVVTSLAPDHLDRYDSVESYYADKARLFRNATDRSHWVLNAENEGVMALPGKAPGFRHLYRRQRNGELPGTAAAYLDQGVLTLHPAPDEPLALVHTDQLRILGRHNVLNALAAALAAHLAGADPESIRDGLITFRPLPHRMEPVGTADGVLWVNDSKATNVEAATAAIESLDRPVVLLLGGKDKGEDFTPLAVALERGSRAAVLFGEAAARIEASLLDAWGDRSPCILVREDGGFAEAVDRAANLSMHGDLLLLAPACSSFDQFENYEERGRRFIELARAAGVTGPREDER